MWKNADTTSTGKDHRRMSAVAIVVLAVLLAGLLAACGESEDDNGSGGDATPTPMATETPVPISHPTGASDIVLKIEVTGGFVPPHFLITDLPAIVILGDGSVVTPGPQIAIYPGPALPNLRVTRITEEGVQAILREAKAAGLLDGDAQYPQGGIADAPTTYFTVNAGGRVSNVTAYALGIDVGTGGNATPEVEAARKKLYDFWNKMSSLTWLPANAIVSQDEPYVITRLQIVSQPVDLAFNSGSPDVTPQEKDWPLTTPLAEYGEPFFMQQSRCFVLEGADLSTMLTALKDANQITRWISEETKYILYLRPLIGDEQSCLPPG